MNFARLRKYLACDVVSCANVVLVAAGVQAASPVQQGANAVKERSVTCGLSNAAIQRGI